MSDERAEPTEEAPEPLQSRRRWLQTMAAAAGAVGATRLLGAARAEAADGGNFVLGVANAATSKTSLATSGPVSNDGALSVTAAAADYGIYGAGAAYGVVGSGPGGVLGLGTVGGVFSGSVVAINLDPQDSPGAPTGQAFKGDLAVDSNGVLWLCVAAGTPGTWIRVSHGGVRFLTTPVRAYDSRNTTDGKLGAPGKDGSVNNPRVIQITGVITGIPANAVGLVGNLTVTQGSGANFATIWPGGAWPGTSNVNFNADDAANSFQIGISGGGSVSLASWQPAHAIIDIAGYVL